MSDVTVVEFTDPTCPWAWGSEPTFRWLRALLGPQTRWRRVFGILFDDDDDPCPDPAAETAWYQQKIADIATHTEAPVPENLERVAATSWPSSLAAKAAEAQGRVVAERVLRRLREYTFVLGTPPDTPDRVLAAASGVPGLDLIRLEADINTAPVREAVRRDHTETRAPCAEVLGVDDPGPHNGRAKETDDGWRYALPTLVFSGPAGRAVVPGWRDPGEYLGAVRRVAPWWSARSFSVTPTAALEAYRSLTRPELTRLTGADSPPAGAVEVPTGNGPIWLHADEAATHPALRHR